jgi:hypothetical protein
MLRCELLAICTWPHFPDGAVWTHAPQGTKFSIAFPKFGGSAHDLALGNPERTIGINGFKLDPPRAPVGIIRINETKCGHGVSPGSISLSRLAERL